MNQEAMQEELIRDEGLRVRPYRDSVGKLTIGVGRNLEDVGISRSEALAMLDNDIAAACAALDTITPWWRLMNEVRQRVLVNMCFNLGPRRLAGFHLALDAMQRGDYEEAANQMLASTWATEVLQRARRLASLMRFGE